MRRFVEGFGVMECRGVVEHGRILVPGTTRSATKLAGVAPPSAAGYYLAILFALPGA
jgi:hypothetical protein